VNEAVVPMERLEHSYAIGGCDLSATTDLTCASLLIRKPGDESFYVLQKYFLPEARVDAVEASSAREAPYKLWAEQGWLHICPGATVDFSAVTAWFVEMVEQHDIRPLWIGYDRALAGYWVEEMTAAGFDMEKIAQGPFTFSYPMKRLGGLFEEHKIISNNNPMLRWCVLNTSAKSANRSGVDTIQPEKTSKSKRIDGLVSLLNAFVCYTNHEDEFLRYVR
jgi:phage terminase large subunit-like protein